MRGVITRHWGQVAAPKLFAKLICKEPHRNVSALVFICACYSRNIPTICPRRTPSLLTYASQVK